MTEVRDLLIEVAKAADDGDFNKAFGVLEDAAARFPGDSRVYLVRGYMLYLSGQPKEALSEYDRAIQLNSDSSFAWRRKAESLIDLNRLNEALSCIDEAIGKNPEDDVSWELGGRILGLMDRFDDSISAYEQALMLNPESDKAWAGKAIVLALRGNYGEALSCIQKAASLKPEDADYREQVGRIKSFRK